MSAAFLPPRIVRPQLNASDIIELLTEALQAIGVADKKLLQACTKADSHDPGSSAVT